MKHFASSKFWKYFNALPSKIQSLGYHNYALLQENPAHPSLHFKSVFNSRFRSVRINKQWRICFVWHDKPYDVEIVDYH